MKLNFTLAIISALFIGIAIGLCISMFFISNTITSSMNNLKVEKIEIGFNETYIMDRLTNFMNESLNINKTCKGMIGGKNDVCI